MKKDKNKTKYAKNPNLSKSEKKRYVKILKGWIESIKDDEDGRNYSIIRNVKEMYADDYGVKKDVIYSLERTELTVKKEK